MGPISTLNISDQLMQNDDILFCCYWTGQFNRPDAKTPHDCWPLRTVITDHCWLFQRLHTQHEVNLMTKLVEQYGCWQQPSTVSCSIKSQTAWSSVRSQKEIDGDSQLSLDAMLLAFFWALYQMLLFNVSWNFKVHKKFNRSKVFQLEHPSTEWL